MKKKKEVWFAIGKYLPPLAPDNSYEYGAVAMRCREPEELLERVKAEHIFYDNLFFIIHGSEAQKLISDITERLLFYAQHEDKVKPQKGEELPF